MYKITFSLNFFFLLFEFEVSFLTSWLPWSGMSPQLHICLRWWHLLSFSHCCRIEDFIRRARVLRELPSNRAEPLQVSPHYRWRWRATSSYDWWPKSAARNQNKVSWLQPAAAIERAQVSGRRFHHNLQVFCRIQWNHRHSCLFACDCWRLLRCL